MVAAKDAEANDEIVKDSFFLFLKGNNLTEEERLELCGRGWTEKNGTWIND